MNVKGKKQNANSDEFKRFEELTKKLVSVPKKEIQDREKKDKAKKSGKKPSNL